MTLVVEDFNDLSDWTQWAGAGGSIFTVSNGNARSTTAVGAAVHNTPMDSDDHFVRISATDAGGSGQFVGIVVRGSPDGQTGYCVYLGVRAPASGDTNLILYRFNGDQYTKIGEAGSAYVANSFFGLKAKGSRISVLDATGNEAISVVDTTYSGKHCGLYGFGANLKVVNHYSSFDLGTVLSDDFNREDSELSESGPGWDCFGTGFWGVRSNRAQITGTITTRYGLLTLPTLDYEIEATINKGSSNSVGLTGRFLATNNLFGVRVSGSGGLGAFTTINGTTTIIQENILPYVSGGTRYRMKFQGDAVVVYHLNLVTNEVLDSWSTTITSPTLLLGNRCGMRGQGHSTQPWWDDIRISAIELEAEPEPTSSWSWWDGTTEQPLTLEGVWDGASIIPVSSVEVTT